MRPEFAFEIENIFKSFESEIDILRQCPPSKHTDIPSRAIVISAYAKAYDFVRYMCQMTDLKPSFFQLPMLRGICEDLIAISYLITQSKAKQNYLIVTKRHEELKLSTKAQAGFFSKYNKGQIVAPPLNHGDIQIILDEYRRAGHDFENAKLPKVYTMAKRVGLKDLYSFIYHSTSKAVHFDIFTLLSMGWGKLDKKERTIEANYSHEHDYKHYYSFGVFYSTYLFIYETIKFEPFLDLPPKIKKQLSTLEEVYKQIDWPELVTFSQLNIKPPNTLTKAIFRVIKNEIP
ncbi:DUF5677 domain-containing protein [Paraflavitalea pollutisoli]|uniref:DUF5677 domain-containing protein n=1 Tax=Paraflavitalea pollutisoli TaxID=3034143 RepID=UPI0023EAEEE4|nr:DUF5677 domain-containing protein [Paraflavitalea sp. H1-2-19X]